MCLVSFSSLVRPQTAQDLDFLSGQTDGRDLRQALGDYLRREAAALRPRREGQDPAARKQLLRAKFLEGIGGLPERTPLNAKVAGVIDHDGYKIEKIIFESQPRFYVTANLYLPKSGSPPYPAILFPLGHEPGGKAYPVWQQLLVTFAQRGYVALAWDPAGQGERIQMFDSAFEGSILRSSTLEHTEQGIQCLLAGDAFARYTVWDGIRALDYLLSRPEVDPKRVGVTGNSGGGTHSAYLAALDDRLQVAAPSCFLTSWSRLLETSGPQDAEQCIPGFLGAGLEHVDFVLSFAPKPYLMLSAIRDFFSIAGARSTYGQAEAAYAKLGAAGRMAIQEADEGHGYSKELRLASYRWFGKWLKGAEEQEGETAIQPAPEHELWCTRTGQVSTSLGGETVFSLNHKRVRSFNSLPDRKVSPEALRKIIGWRDSAGAVQAWSYGRMTRAGLTVEKLLLETEPGIRLPALVVSSPEPRTARPGVLVADGRGKSQAWPQIQALAQGGAVVMAVDLRGLGETRTPAALYTKGDEWASWFGDYDSAMTAILLGRTLVGMRAFDIEKAREVLVSRAGVDSRRIYGAGYGAGAVAILHAAAAGTPFSGLLLDTMLGSYRAVAEHPLHRRVFENIVPGALRHYDLPDLAAGLAPRPVWIVDPVTPMGQVLLPDEAKGALVRAASAHVVFRVPEEDPAKAYRFLLE